MAMAVIYSIIDRPDGRFDTIVILGALKQRVSFPTLAEAEEWIEGLRVLMAACGSSVVHSTTTPTLTSIQRDFP
jgi:hypothetical protein